MKIAVLHFHRLGGSGVVAYEIARGMVERGHEVHFVGLSPPFRMQEYEETDKEWEGLYFHFVEFKFYPVFDHQPYDLALASRLAGVIEEFGIEVIHCHYAIPHTAAALLARDILGIDKKKLKIITTLHGTDVSIVGADKSMYSVTRYLIEKSDVVISVSNYLKKKTEDFFKIAPTKIQTIYNFLSPDFFPKEKNFCSNNTSKERWILHSSTLREVKAPFDVITIFQMLIEKTQANLKLVIAGDGPLKEAMEVRVNALGLSDKVDFLGMVRDMPSLYSRCCFCVLPSYEEAFGLAALEAMSFGIPVLAAKAGGLVEIIEDGRNGILFSNRNLTEGVEKLLQLVENDEAYLKISKNAAQTARNDFSAKRALDAYEKAYSR